MATASASTLAPAPALGILEALNKSTPDELEKLDKQIEEQTAALDKLKNVRKLLAVFLGVDKKPSGQAASGGGASGDGRGAKIVRTKQLRDKIAAYCLASGPANPQRKSTIIQQFQLQDGEFEHLTNHGWFVVTPEGVKLTPAGREAAAA